MRGSNRPWLAGVDISKEMNTLCTGGVMETDYMTLNEAAEYMHCTKRWINQLVNEGYLTARLATMSERKRIKGANFHSRLLLVPVDEVIRYYTEK